MAKFGGITKVNVMLMSDYELDNVEALCTKKLDELKREKEINPNFVSVDVTEEELEAFLNLISAETVSRTVERDRATRFGKTPPKDFTTRQIIEFLESNERQMTTSLRDNYQLNEKEIAYFLRRSVTQENAASLGGKVKRKISDKGYDITHEPNPDKQLVDFMNDTVELSTELTERIKNLPAAEREELLDAIRKQKGKIVAIEKIRATIKKQEQAANGTMENEEQNVAAPQNS